MHSFRSIAGLKRYSLVPGLPLQVRAKYEHYQEYLKRTVLNLSDSEQSPDTITVRPFSVNIYFYPVQ